MIYTWKPKSGKNHGWQRRHKIHYNMRVQRWISKQTSKEDINKVTKKLLQHSLTNLKKYWNREEGKTTPKMSHNKWL